MNTTKNHSFSTEHIKKLVCAALFCALAFVVSFCFPIKVQFLTFDAKDAIIAIGGMFFGPVFALTISVVVPVLEFISFSDTGFYGLIMNFLSSAAFSVTASLVYKYRRNMSGAIIALFSSVVVVTGVMLLANMVITPIYVKLHFGMSLGDVLGMLPTLLLPFNLTKSVLNASLVLLLYKPFTTALRATRLASTKGPVKKSSPVVSIICIVCALLVFAAAVFVYIKVLHGSIAFLG